MLTRFSSIAASCLAVAMLVVGCAEQKDPLDPVEIYGQAEHTEVEEPIGWTSEPYDFSGPTPIGELEEMFDTGGAPVWYGFSPDDPYAQGGDRVIGQDCDPGQFQNVVDPVADLPATIEGVVTLHPRYFQKVPVCGQDQRYYGAFFIEDESGGILVLKDSRIADFSYGDRVRLRVRGVMEAFGARSVLIFDEQEVVDPDTKHDISFEELDRELEQADKGRVRRVSGTIVGEPTNANFNEMIIENADGLRWTVSLDRELGLRVANLTEGRRVQITGPVIDSFGVTIIVASLGQIEWLD